MSDWYPGIREFCTYWKHAPTLQQTLDTLEQEFEQENDACIDAAKGFVECACKLLIKELDDVDNPIKGWPDSPIKDETPSSKAWMTAVIRLLELSDERDIPFKKVISQHVKLTEELGKYRNLAGTISHGKNALSAKLSTHHRRAALLAADAIVTFLHQAYLERVPDPVHSIEPYERFNTANELIDNYVSITPLDNDDLLDGWLQVEVHIPTERENIQLTISPSQLLFGVDREAFKAAFNAAQEAALLDKDVEEESEVPDGVSVGS